MTLSTAASFRKYPRTFQPLVYLRNHISAPCIFIKRDLVITTCLQWTIYRTFHMTVQACNAAWLNYKPIFCRTRQTIWKCDLPTLKSGMFTREQTTKARKLHCHCKHLDTAHLVTAPECLEPKTVKLRLQLVPHFNNCRYLSLVKYNSHHTNYPSARLDS